MEKNNNADNKSETKTIASAFESLSKKCEFDELIAIIS